jgi:hypothetical protein
MTEYVCVCACVCVCVCVCVCGCGCVWVCVWVGGRVSELVGGSLYSAQALHCKTLMNRSAQFSRSTGP